MIPFDIGDKVRLLGLIEKLKRVPAYGGTSEDVDPMQFTRWETSFLAICFEESTGISLKHSGSGS